MISLRLFLIILTTAVAARVYSQSDDSIRIVSCIESSKKFEEQQPDSAVDICNQGMKLAEGHNDLRGQALLLLQLGRINGIHHHNDLARRFANEALSIFRSLRDWKNIALTYNELGLLDGSGSLTDATSELGRSMEFYENMHDSSGIASTWMNMGAVYEKNGETEKALSWYLRALVHYEHASRKPQEYFLLLQNISRVYSRKGDRQAALKYLEEGLHNDNSPLYRDTEITMLEEEGQLLEASGKNAGALVDFKREFDSAKKYDNLEGQAHALADIAGVLKKDNAARSLEYLKKALGIAQGLKEPFLKANIYEAMAGVYRQEKNYKEAMAALDEHHRLLDSLLTSKTNSDILALDTSYQLEVSRERIDQLTEVNKKEKTRRNLSMVIVVLVLLVLFALWGYVRKMRRLNQQLNQSNQVRDKLFSIIGHDLKGPAGNSVQALELLEKGVLPAEQQGRLVNQLKKQSAASFDLLNALFEWGQAQLNGVKVSPERFSAKDVVRKNIGLLGPSAARKDIVICDETPEEVTLFADPNHFDFIIRNLLSNAIKFTREQGRIVIRQSLADGSVVFSVADTGIGISKEKQEAFLKTGLPVVFGTKGEKGSGLGLMLIKEFVTAGGGRIWLTSKEGEGSAFYVSFPAAEGGHRRA
ncbi:tetratricopeptide repeat-containing sensor histidine kinase [Puia sp. P3]|uniref:tetratricopeptide repeat-containing sensor histidine kinase n=1 Tax=Puia sp. P3 TaxID=3423952 RepID=UPI003D665A2D